MPPEKQKLDMVFYVRGIVRCYESKALAKLNQNSIHVSVPKINISA